MPRLAQTEIKTSAFVDKDDLYRRGVVFAITGAELRHDPPPFGDQVIFNIQSGADIGQFSMSANPIRLQYVDHFKNGGDVIENMKLYQIPSTKGNPAWGMADAGDEAYESQVFLPLYPNDSAALPSGNSSDDIPF